MSTLQEQAQRAYRDQVNWRSVSRADPAVQDILNTCTFCSVFIFDTVKDEWVKQKQEGPLFLVKRKKEPEYGLYMLNRATVKNVLWALIPGEMRVTPTSDDMLIVERRGEGIKTGIHFGDGKAVVEEFRSTIISICGDPRQKSGSAPPPQPQAQAQSRSQPQSQPQPRRQNTSSPAQTPQDDLSRLFSGILSVPASSSSSRPPSATNNQVPSAAPVRQNGNNNWATQTTNSASTSTQAGPGGPYSQSTRPERTTPVHNTSAPVRPDTPPSPPITFSEIPVSPPQSPDNTHPPRQTVADLLNSIGGGPSRSPVNAPPPGQTVADLLNSISGGSNFAIPPPPIRQPSPIRHLHHPHPPSPPNSRRPLPPTVPPHPQPRPRERPPHLPASYPQVPTSDPATLARYQEAFLDTLPLMYQPSGPDPQVAFQRDLIDMLEHDPGFVDQLYRAFMARGG